MPLQFEPVRLAMQEEYLKRLAACPQKTSDYSFANVYGWAEEYGLELGFGDSHVWIRQTRPEPVLWAPVGPWHTVDWAKCPSLRGAGRLTRVPLELGLLWKEALGQAVELHEARGHWDYVYDVAELVELRGNRFHRKKNLLNQFLKKYDYTYHPMDADCVEAVLEMQAEWCMWRECEDSGPLVAENQAIARVLQSWDRIPGLMGGSLYVDGRMAAYTVAEELSPNVLVIHFEKGRPEYRGVYQAINQMFLAEQGRDFELVNREQDLDDEGLRKAKLSYNPVAFNEKYEAVVN
jgi:hypothetical protein